MGTAVVWWAPESRTKAVDLAAENAQSIAFFAKYKAGMLYFSNNISVIFSLQLFEFHWKKGQNWIFCFHGLATDTYYNLGEHYRMLRCLCVKLIVVNEIEHFFKQIPIFNWNEGLTIVWRSFEWQPTHSIVEQIFDLFTLAREMDRNRSNKVFTLFIRSNLVWIGWQCQIIFVGDHGGYFNFGLILAGIAHFDRVMASVEHNGTNLVYNQCQRQ